MLSWEFEQRSPVLPTPIHMAFWAVWFLVASALLGIFGAATAQHSRPPTAARACGAASITIASILLLGAASGGQSVIQPLGHLRVSDAAQAHLRKEPSDKKWRSQIRSATPVVETV